MESKINLPKDTEGQNLYIYTPGATVTLDGSVTPATLEASEHDRQLRLCALFDARYSINTEATEDDVPLPQGTIEVIYLPAGRTLSVYGAKLVVTEVV